MADYVVGALLVVAFVFAARSYFGRKYKGCGDGCSGCPHAQECMNKDKRKD